MFTTNLTFICSKSALYGHFTCAERSFNGAVIDFHPHIYMMRATASGDDMYQITELNKQTGERRILSRFDNEEEAKDFWRQVAFENIDHAHLWHRLEREDKDKS